MLALLEEDILKGSIRRELRLGKDEMGCRERILSSTDLGLDNLVEEVPMRPELVYKATLIVRGARLQERLEVLNVVLITQKLELDQLWGTILNLELKKLKEDVVLDLDRLHLVWEVIVVGHRKKTLDRGTSRHKLDNGIHTKLIGC